MPPIALRAFLGRAHGIEAEAVTRYLHAEGVQVDDPTLRVESHDPPSAALLGAIRTCDLGVIVYAPKSDHLLYELGALDALRKPVVIVAERLSELPTAFLRHMVVRSPLTGSEELLSAIQRVVAEIRRSHKGESKRTRDPLNTARKVRRKRIKVPRVLHAASPEEVRAWPPKDIEQTVAALLESAGGLVEAHGFPGDRGADLVFWSASASAVLPQPLLIEVKAGQLSWAEIHAAEARLQRAVNRSGATGGLLVYVDRAGAEFSGHSEHSNVRRISYARLVDELAKNPLNTAIRKLLLDTHVEPGDG